MPFSSNMLEPPSVVSEFIESDPIIPLRATRRPMRIASFNVENLFSPRATGDTPEA